MLDCFVEAESDCIYVVVFVAQDINHAIKYVHYVVSKLTVFCGGPQKFIYVNI